MATRSRSKSAQVALPPIAALFHVVFDRKVGYKIAWKQAIKGLDMDGVVEYKSLPSGLHNCHEDLVYFVHDQYAGISAFASRPAHESQRNATFSTVGVLVPLIYGRLGRSWLHAEQLRNLTNVANDLNATDILQEYWQQHRIEEQDVSNGHSSTNTSHRKRRALSDAAGLHPTNPTLSKHHPAMSLAQHLDTFGPLLFPLQRAALLKKRILIMTSAPVRAACNLVYNLSVLSNIPHSAADTIRDKSFLLPSRPLFNIGIHDIDYLGQLADEEKPQSSWIACTTDDILATKSKLYDVLVELPSARPDASGAKQWPQIRTSNGEAIKATQRDLRRYYTLKREVNRVRNSQGYRDIQDEEEDDNGDEDESAPLAPPQQQDATNQEQYVQLEGETGLAEPSSWASIAYTSFLWWASAGEKDALLDDEACQDARLLDDLPLPTTHRSSSRSGGTQPSCNRNLEGVDDGAQSVAVILIAYAHRLTTTIMETLADIVVAAEAEDGRVDESFITIDSTDMRRMGLDEWSQSDGTFVKDMAALYFGREHVKTLGRPVDFCGIKIC